MLFIKELKPGLNTQKDSVLASMEKNQVAVGILRILLVENTELLQLNPILETEPSCGK